VGGYGRDDLKFSIGVSNHKNRPLDGVIQSSLDLDGVNLGFLGRKMK